MIPLLSRVDIIRKIIDHNPLQIPQAIKHRLPIQIKKLRIFFNIVQCRTGIKPINLLLIIGMTTGN